MTCLINIMVEPPGSARIVGDCAAIIVKAGWSVSSETGCLTQKDPPQICVDKRGSYSNNRGLILMGFSDSYHPRESAADHSAQPKSSACADGRRKVVSFDAACLLVLLKPNRST